MLWRATPCRASQSTEVCASIDVSLYFELYRNGYELGLPYYGTREIGFETANCGSDFALQCPRETLPRLAVGFSEGLNVLALKTQMREIEIQINEKSDQAEAFLKQIGQLRTARDNIELNKDALGEARYQPSQLESLSSTLNQDIETLTLARDDVFAEIDALTEAFYPSL